MLEGEGLNRPLARQKKFAFIPKQRLDYSSLKHANGRHPFDAGEGDAGEWDIRTALRQVVCGKLSWLHRDDF